jgi:hypothetical protein
MYFEMPGHVLGIEAARVQHREELLMKKLVFAS